MQDAKRQAVEAVGWRFGDAADFLEMTEEERRQLDARIEAITSIRETEKNPRD